MVAVASCLVLLYAVAVSALGSLQGACTTNHIGSPTKSKYPFEPVLLQPNVPDWEVQIPSTTNCQVAGIEAIVCDSDVEPTSSFLNQNVLLVHRNGNLQGYAEVQVTLNCVSFDSSAGTVSPQTLLDQASKNLILRPH